MTDKEDPDVVAASPLGAVPTIDHQDGDPMTDKQAAVLRALCDKKGEEFDTALTRRQAAERIEALRD